MTSTITTTKMSKKQPANPVATPQDSPMQQRNIDTMLAKEKSASTSSLQSIQETLLQMQEAMARTQATLENNRDEAKQHHEELKTEMGEVKDKVKGIDEKVENIQQTLLENEQKFKIIEERVEKVEQKIEGVEERNAMSAMSVRNLEEAIAHLQMERASYNLRFQNIIEEKGENLKEKMTEIIAAILQTEPQNMRREIEEAYRVHTNFVRRHHLPREVHVRFVRRDIRDDIYKWSRSEKISYKEKEIIILKQIPRSIRENRRQYQFLTKRLIKDNIMFRWLIPEGLQITWQERRIKIDTLEQARNFGIRSGLITEEQVSRESRESREDLEDRSQEEGRSREEGGTVEEEEKQREDIRKQEQQERTRESRYPRRHK